MPGVRRIGLTPSMSDRLSQEEEDKVPLLKVTVNLENIRWEILIIKKKINLGLRDGVLVQSVSNKWAWLPDSYRKARLWGVVIPALESQTQKKKQILNLVGHVPAQCNTWGMIPEFVLRLPHAHAYMYKRAYICVFVYLYTHEYMPHTYILTNSACSMTINLLVDHRHSIHFLSGGPLVSFQDYSYWIWNSPC